eukprot:TRINITY_DN8326_c0_g1_i1.p1 TRINITY_DN8326_c0_g1~~TRINITY_DN8326_c0_g1_i1.p1  ORF type:complete len:318 (+),score=73.32 TRINITY_DN8326_c0_g1_i1:139-1092(+)
MVLWIENDAIQMGSTSLDGLVPLILSNAAVIQRASEIASHQTRYITSTDGKNLYVFQREFATISLDSGIKFLGTSEATSCNMVIIRSKSSGKTSCAHADGSSKQVGGDACSIQKMISTFTSEESSAGFDLHIVGGMLDDKNYSLKLATSILRVLHLAPFRFDLVTGCFYSLNNRTEGNVNVPLVRGLAIDVKTGEVFPAEFADDCKPDLELRNARFTSGPQLINIYDAKLNIIIIEPFGYQFYSAVDMQVLLRLPDKKILEMFSTTPKAESEHFVPNLKKMMTFILANPDPNKFFGGNPRAFAWNATNKTWDLLALS